MPNIRFAWLGLCFSLFSSLHILLSPNPTNAEIITTNNNTRLVQGNTGTAPFDSDDSAGNDSAEDNSIVRTFDTIAYEVVYVINDSSDDVTIELTLDSNRLDARSGQEWTQLPGLCSGAGSVITGDTLICNLGDLAEPNGGSLTGSLTAIATITADTPNTTEISVSANITAEGEPLTDLGNLTNIVSAAPKPDLSKTGISDSSDPDQGINPNLVGLRPDPSGATAEQGAVYAYPLALLISGGKGGEALQGTLSITDDLSNYSPNARLYVDSDGDASNDNTYSDDDAGCNWNGPTSTTGIIPFGSLPNGKTSANGGPSDPDEEAVSDSGTWTCSQTDAGEEVTITISGADLSGVHTPSLSRNGSALTATDKYLLSGVIMIWIPLSDFPESGSLDVTNSFDAITVTGVSGTTVTENSASLDNNDSLHTIVAGSGGFNTYYIASASNDDRNNPVPGQTETNSGNGSVLATQTFGKRITARNRGVVAWSSNPADPFILCDKIDNQTHIVTELTAGSGMAHVVDFDPNDNSFNYTVEYGTGDYTTPDIDEDTDANIAQAHENQRQATCNDDDSPQGWKTNFNEFTNGAADVTKIRFIANDPLEPDVRLNLYINFTALNQEPDGDPIDPGRILANHSASKVDVINNGNWSLGSYIPTSHSGGVARGDRLFLTRAIARVEKFVNGTNQSTSAQVETPVTFTLNPTLSAPIDTDVVTSLTLTDTLPQYLNYEEGTETGCDPGGSPACQFTSQANVDGTTTLTWTWSNVTPNDTIPDLTFHTQADQLVSTGSTLVNTAVVESPEDFSPIEERTDTASVIITNPSSFSISKNTVTPTLSENGDMVFSLFLANTGDKDIASGLFIDILPYNSDGRSPATTFTGSLGYKSISGSNGETFLFTNEADRSKLESPNDPNLITDVTWCSEAQFGSPDCPDLNGSDVSAVLISMPTFPSGDPIRQIDMVLNTSGASGDNLYTNEFRGLPSTLGVITSNAVPVTLSVSDPNVLLVKRITGINGNRVENPNDATPLNQVIDDTASTFAEQDNHPHWPSDYLLGALNAGMVVSGDIVEYTIYFLNAGGGAATDVRICDRIQRYQSFLFNIYGDGNDILLELGNDPTDSIPNIIYNLTAQNDTQDRAQFIPSGNSVSSACNIQGENDNGTLDVQLTGDNGDPNLPTLPGSTGQGTPESSYGFIRFSTRLGESDSN